MFTVVGGLFVPQVFISDFTLIRCPNVPKIYFNKKTDFLALLN